MIKQQQSHKMKLPSTQNQIFSGRTQQHQQQDYVEQGLAPQQQTHAFSSGSSHDQDIDTSYDLQQINKIGNQFGVSNLYAGIGEETRGKAFKIKTKAQPQQKKKMQIKKKKNRMITSVIAVLVTIGVIMIGMLISDKQSTSSVSSLSNQQLTAIFIITNAPNLAIKSINSFIQQNPCKKVIIASHVDQSKGEGSSLQHDNIEWVIEKRPNYDIFFIDELIKKVQTQYFFYANTQYYYPDDKFVQFSINILKEFSEVGQVMGIVGNQVQNRDLAQRKVGFSFLPGVHRTKDYHLTPDGFASVTKDSSSDLYKSQILISRFYLSKGKYVMAAPGSFKIKAIQQKQDAKSKKNKTKNKQKTKKTSTVDETQRQTTNNNNQINSLVPNKDDFAQQTQSSFKNNFINAQHFSSMQDYLSHNKVRKLLLINCNQLCSSKFSSQIFYMKKINKFTEIQNSDAGKEVYDWISFQRFAPFLNDVMQRSVNIGDYVKYGVSLLWNMESNSDKVTTEISQYFIAKGFYYDEAKSLCLRKVQQKIVMIFIKGQKLKPKYQIEFFQEPLHNFLGIQTVLKLRQNLPYIRQWLIYHINMGFDKFFLYDNTNSLGSNLDPKSSKFKNKFGMSLDCVMLQTEAMDQWRYLWAQFYDHIVYVLWQPKDQFERIIYGQVQSQHDFLQYYKQVPKYTLFIDVDQFIFSPLDQVLQTYLNHYSANRITSIKLKQRHFQSRFCAKNKRVTQISNYFPEDDDRLWGVKVMAETIYFSPFGDISQGRVNMGRQIVVPAEQFRINHYNFEKSGLKIARKNRYSAYTKFQTDNSMSKYKQKMDKLCNNKCSQIFAINCPAGQQWNTCLDVTKSYPLDSYEQIDRVDQNSQKKQQAPTPAPAPAPVKKPNPPAPAPNPYPAAADYNRRQQPIQKVSDYLVSLMKSLIEPTKLFQIQLIKQLPYLPFCIFVMPSQKYSAQTLQNSISIQNYPNVRTVPKPDTEQNYFGYYQILYAKCQQNAFVMFVNSPLKEGALIYINKVMQKFRAWTAYTKNDLTTQIIGFYMRIYELLDVNDFTGRNKQLLKNQNIVTQVFGMLQLCQQSAKELQKEQIYATSSQQTYFSVQRSNQQKLDRFSYPVLIRLSQDMDANVGVSQRSRQSISSARISPLMKLNTDNMYRAIDRQQQWFLPQTHSIVQLQFEQYSTLYNISQFTALQSQVHFCITILNHNNIQNNRYIKVMKSIVMQKYENYHIVFIDDNSTDDNLNKTIEYMRKIGFPRDRIIYVQNLRRNFATYNIINAAFNFCGEDDVQMLMDGDDQFVGRYAFQVMNSAYQNQQDIWVAYSNYKTNFYGFGRSRGLTSDYDHAAGSRRSYVSFFGAIRSFRVKVIRSIPPKHHKMSNGQWLDTVYDDALCHPLFEISGYKRVAYVPELLYEYNMRYGDNDDSTSQKIRHRSQVYRYMISIPTLMRLDNITVALKDPEIEAELKNDLNVRYLVVPP